MAISPNIPPGAFSSQGTSCKPADPPQGQTPKPAEGGGLGAGAAVGEAAQSATGPAVDAAGGHGEIRPAPSGDNQSADQGGSSNGQGSSSPDQPSVHGRLNQYA